LIRLEKILLDNPEFVKISFANMNKIISEKFTMCFDPNKTWVEMGFDELDLVEMIMEMEKQFDFVFSDIFFDEIFEGNNHPIDFSVLSRNNKIDKLLKSP
jgi:acyl carrier protein